MYSKGYAKSNSKQSLLPSERGSLSKKGLEDIVRGKFKASHRKN